jgi:hypothetical protein
MFKCGGPGHRSVFGKSSGGYSITLSDDGPGCKISWSSNWIAKGAPEAEVREMLPGFYRDIFAGVVRAG